jgi:hypothetical protein
MYSWTISWRSPYATSSFPPSRGLVAITKRFMNHGPCFVKFTCSKKRTKRAWKRSKTKESEDCALEVSNEGWLFFRNKKQPHANTPHAHAPHDHMDSGPLSSSASDQFDPSVLEFSLSWYRPPSICILFTSRFTSYNKQHKNISVWKMRTDGRDGRKPTLLVLSTMRPDSEDQDKEDDECDGDERISGRSPTWPGLGSTLNHWGGVVQP